MFLRNICRILTALYLRKKRSINIIYAHYATAFISCLLSLSNLKTLLTLLSTYVVHNTELMFCELFCGLCTEKQNSAIETKRLWPSSSILRYVYV
jgi:hypothetical protein